MQVSPRVANDDAMTPPLPDLSRSSSTYIAERGALPSRRRRMRRTTSPVTRRRAELGSGTEGDPLRKPGIPESNVAPGGKMRKTGSTMIPALAFSGAKLESATAIA